MGQPGVLPTALDQGCRATADAPIVRDREIEAIHQLIAEFVEGGIIVSVRSDRYPFQRQGSRSSTFVIL